MKKVQFEVIELEEKDGKTDPLHSPFTGELLIHPDKNKDPDWKMSDSSVLIYSTDFIDEGPIEVYEPFEKMHNWNKIRDMIDGFALVENHEKLNDDYQYIVLMVNISGTLPGDFSSIIFVVREKMMSET